VIAGIEVSHPSGQKKASLKGEAAPVTPNVQALSRIVFAMAAWVALILRLTLR
jgi:hypothetical protein